MEPDPSELKAIDDALAAFDAAYVDLVQSVMRIRRIYEIGKAHPAPEPRPPSVYAPENRYSGTPCPRCHSIRVIDKGGGCLRCLECSFDLGCNG